MTYAAYDASAFGGQPVELYEFLINGVLQNYCAGEEQVITAGDIVWLPTMLSRGSFVTGLESERSSISIRVSISSPILEVFKNGFPEGAIGLKIYRTHVTDPDREIKLIWDGEVTSKIMRGREVTLKGEVPQVSLRSLGLRRRYQSSCPYPLYYGGCGVDKALHRVSATIVSVNGKELTTNLADCSPFTGGFVSHLLSGHTVTRFIEKGEGAVMTLKQEADWLIAGLVVSAYPGCNKTAEVCQTVFNNLPSFGGFPGMPRDNPFNTQVY